MKKILSILIASIVATNTVNANIFDDTKMIEKTGDVLMFAVPTYASLLTIYNDDFLKGNAYLISGILITQGLSEGIKRLVQEKRPNYKKGDKKHAFPSGHAAGAFSGATFIHKRYGLNQAIVPYILSTYVGYARVKAKKHWVHDVLAGAVLSGVVNYFLVETKDKNTMISFENLGDGAMLSYKKSF